jgi:hypothetical protein
MWLRQGGKTSSLVEKALKKMMLQPEVLITFISASLSIGSEFVEGEAKAWLKMLDWLKAASSEKGKLLEAGETSSGHWRKMPDNFDIAAFSEVLEHNKFELRLNHTRTIYSRTKVIAPNIATARSYSGPCYLDEASFIRYLQLLMQEIEPIFSTDPSFTFEWCTTPSSDSAHYSNKLLTPRDGRTDFPLNPKGNWFLNQVGLWVHRVDINDAAEAGRKCYNMDSGEEETVEQNREGSSDREGWDRSNLLKLPTTGTGAVSPAALTMALQAGRNAGIAREIPCDSKASAVAALIEALEAAEPMIGHNRMAWGHDLATSEGKKANPSSLCLAEEIGPDVATRLLVWWKTSSPEIATALVLEGVKWLRDRGRRAVGISIDASNEVHFARMLKTALTGIIPVWLVAGGSKPKDETRDYKTVMGDLAVSHFESGRILLASDQRDYIEQDFSRVRKMDGRYSANTGSNGEHADTWDAFKHALYRLKSRPVGGTASAARVGRGTGAMTPSRPGLLRDLCPFFRRKN